MVCRLHWVMWSSLLLHRILPLDQACRLHRAWKCTDIPHSYRGEMDYALPVHTVLPGAFVRCHRHRCRFRANTWHYTHHCLAHCCHHTLPLIPGCHFRTKTLQQPKRAEHTRRSHTHQRGSHCVGYRGRGGKTQIEMLRTYHLQLGFPRRKPRS